MGRKKTVTKGGTNFANITKGQVDVNLFLKNE